MNSDIVSYYKDRAKEYEKIYSKPERQNDLLLAEQILRDTFADKDVFEIACGTGYWTQKLSATAKNIIAQILMKPLLKLQNLKIICQEKLSLRQQTFFTY